MDYETNDHKICIHQARTNDNKKGDYMLSQGFSITHVESTIGCSEQSRKHASDAHDMLTLCGVSSRLAQTVHSSKCDAPSLAESVKPIQNNELSLIQI